MAKDAPSKIKWDKENTFAIAIKFQRKTDQDCIDFLDGKNKRNTICAALREYMINHPEKVEYSYGMRMRGCSPGAQPKNGFLRREDAPATTDFYDIIVYDRPLTEKEMSDYDLEEF